MYWALWAGFCIGKCIAGWLAAGCLLLLLSFSFSFFISSQIAKKKLGFKRDIQIAKKMAPKKVGPLYSLPPLLLTWGGELTLFTTPLLIASRHYIRLFVCISCMFLLEEDVKYANLTLPNSSTHNFIPSWPSSLRNLNPNLAWHMPCNPAIVGGTTFIPESLSGFLVHQMMGYVSPGFGVPPITTAPEAKARRPAFGRAKAKAKSAVKKPGPSDCTFGGHHQYVPDFFEFYAAGMLVVGSQAFSIFLDVYRTG